MKKQKRNSIILFSLARILVFVLVSAFVCSIGLCFRQQIESLINNKPIFYGKSQIDHNGLVVHYIDVGQADCIFIELPDGKNMLIDAGGRETAKQVVEYLQDNVFGDDKQKVIDYVLLTHSDTDHCGGMTKIFDEYQVNFAFRPKIYTSSSDKLKDENAPFMTSYNDNQVYVQTIESMYAEPDCTVIFTTASEMNTTYKIKSENMENYYEFMFYTPTKTSYNSVNEYSPIMTIEYNSKVFMFTGDATEKTEKEAMENYSLPKVDVLKVGHHGSNTSTSQQFLEAILPDYAIIQVGKNNQYGHPTEKILERLKLVNAEVFRTDQNYNIIANVDNQGELKIFADISNATIKVLHLIIGIELILIYFCFFVKYKKV